jgi:4-diphosphocytidyl-2-C-methyl-D-erythritol kinase
MTGTTSIPPSPALSVECPAKINWFLDVARRRSDGYHELDTVMQRISLADRMTFEPVDTDIIECDDGGACGCRAEENLAVRAARRLKESCGCTRGVRIRIEKRVPTGAGLGGGSANAAAALRALATLWSLDVSADILHSIARSLGADVPFFLGTAAARCQGIGDVLIPLAPREFHLVLWNPGMPLSTSAVYAAFDHKPRPRRAATAFLAAYASGDADALAAAVWNNLALASEECSPALATMQRTCLDLGARAAWITGSGPTVACLCASADAARTLARTLMHFAGMNHIVEPVTTLL